MKNNDFTIDNCKILEKPFITIFVCLNKIINSHLSMSFLS